VIGRLFLAFACAASLAAVLIAAPIGAAQTVPVQPQSNAGVSVVGAGIVLAQPDVARITIGVEVFDPSLATAQAQAAKQMDAVVTKLKADGIAENDIRTVSYTVTPQYDQQPNNPNQQVLRGYTVTNLVEVRTTNVAGLGPLIDDAVAAGATRIYGISFEASDMESLKSQARDQAMANASTKAQQLARDASVTLGKPIVIEESDTGGVTPVQAIAPRVAAAPAATTPIQPGQMQISTTVHVTYAIQ
jgi:uncharacterized protein YggE